MPASGSSTFSPPQTAGSTAEVAHDKTAASPAARVVIWGINYAPETTGIAPFNTELAEDLAAAGHPVEVVTAFAYYPQWKKAPEDRFRLYRTDRRNGIAVHRCFQYLPGKVTTLRRIFHELSFGVTSFLRVLSLPRADVYFVASPPLGLGFVAWLATRLKGSRYIFHVQDLQPDAAVGLGMLRKGAFVRALFWLERFAYSHAAAVSGISSGMIDAFRRKGVPAERCVLFPNWLRGAAPTAGERGASTFRARHGVAADDFLAVYSGNLGHKQGIEILLDAAELLHRRSGSDPAASRVRILIVGAGAARESLEQQIASRRLPNLKMLPLLDDADYAAMLSEADVGLITQAAGTGGCFFPSKLLTVLRSRLPVVTVADDDSELAKAVAEGGFGLNSLPGHAEDLATNLERASGDPAVLTELKARTTWVDQFHPRHVLPQFRRRLAEIARGDRGSEMDFETERAPVRS